MLKNYVEEINDMLFEADIEDLIFDDCQYNEYMSESEMINKQINSDMSVEDIALVCMNVFDTMFIPNHSIEQFIQIAENLKELI